MPVMDSGTILALLAGYLLGSIPFGLLLTRLGGKGDIREIGSGNIGATNVLRTGSKGLAAATLLLDGAKGAAAVLLAQQLWPDAVNFAAAGAMIGHLYPAWLRFKGGKGVATLLGILVPLLTLGLPTSATAAWRCSLSSRVSNAKSTLPSSTSSPGLTSARFRWPSNGAVNCAIASVRT